MPQLGAQAMKRERIKLVLAGAAVFIMWALFSTADYHDEQLRHEWRCKQIAAGHIPANSANCEEASK